jgi:hypothetical protein
MARSLKWFGSRCYKVCDAARGKIGKPKRERIVTPKAHAAKTRQGIFLQDDCGKIIEQLFKHLAIII